MTNQAKKFLIVGLGNYNMQQTRHSVGYMLATFLLPHLHGTTQFKLAKTSNNAHQSNNHLVSFVATVDGMTTTDWTLDKQINSHHCVARFNLVLPLGKRRKLSKSASQPDQSDQDPAQQPDGMPVSQSAQPPQSLDSVATESAATESIATSGTHGRHHPKRDVQYAVELHLVKPYSYMNTSGPCVNKAIKQLKIPASNLLVLHDELDEPLGSIKWKWGGSTNGHNGLKSVSTSIGTPNFLRCRIGIGRPKGNSDITHWVLQNFKVAERETLQADAFPKALDGLFNILAHEIMTQSNHSAQKAAVA